MEVGQIVRGLPSANQHYGITSSGTIWVVYHVHSHEIIVGPKNMELFMAYQKLRMLSDDPYEAWDETRRDFPNVYYGTMDDLYCVDDFYFEVIGVFDLTTNNEAATFTLRKEIEL